MTDFESISYKGDGLTCIRSERTVFERLTFSVASGEMLVLKGPNGSGKSSLLRMMAGLIRPRAGDLLLGDISADDDPLLHREKITYAGHLAGLKPSMTLRENLKHYTRITRGTDCIRQEIESVADKLYLSHLVDEQLRYYSQGQTHRAALCKLMMSARPVWLMDEPTVGLDAESRTALAAIMQDHLDKKGILIVATHDPLGLDGKIIELDDFQSNEPAMHQWLDDDTVEGAA